MKSNAILGLAFLCGLAITVLLIAAAWLDDTAGTSDKLVITALVIAFAGVGAGFAISTFGDDA